MKLGQQLLCGFLMVLAVTAAAQDKPAASAVQDDSPTLREELKPLADFIGVWEIDGQWKSGEAIWARSEYSVGMGGNFVEARTWTRNEDGKVYQRYKTIWRWDPQESKVVSHGFVYDGSYLEIETVVSTVDGKSTLTSNWEQGGSRIDQQVQIVDADRYSWKVEVSDGDSRNQLMDGVWVRK